MSRESGNEYQFKDGTVEVIACRDAVPDDAKLLNGYDYKEQCWVEDGEHLPNPRTLHPVGGQTIPNFKDLFRATTKAERLNCQMARTGATPQERENTRREFGQLSGKLQEAYLRALESTV